MLVDKPIGPTSHDIVATIRRQFGFKKVGHGGTLDPQAGGLLIILVGRGTKLSDLFMGSDKVYEGTMTLGIATESFDAQGKVVSEQNADHVTRAQVDAEMKKLTGDIMQTPPMVSAVKVKGVPLYKHARKGRVIERKARLIHIFEFRMLDFQSPTADFIVRCTKGTYVRSLCSDIGEALGCGAHLSRLCRTRSGDMTLANAMPMDELLKLSREQLIADRILPITRFTGLPGVNL
ncbi:MAG: tRNA pseudouridine(55) synthase TruB [Kiritimatiellae bacterium]|nr:tRNA pseudouridine(55) synthase TruB [Kiritimatiellia bacterium]